MVSNNYIKLEPGVPVALHFTDHAVTESEIRDPETSLVKRVRKLTFTVDRVNGREFHTTFSTISSKLASALEGELQEKAYRQKIIVIAQMGRGYTAEFMVRKEPLA